jgi:isocitrate dehydrogenase
MDELQQYDEIVEKEGKDAANEAQSKAEQEGKIIVKDSV